MIILIAVGVLYIRKLIANCISTLLSIDNPRNRYLPDYPPLNTLARLQNGTEEKNMDLYMCVYIGPFAKQGSETVLSNIFEDLNSFCYRSDNHIIVRVLF